MTAPFPTSAPKLLRRRLEKSTTQRHRVDVRRHRTPPASASPHLDVEQFLVDGRRRQRSVPCRDDLGPRLDSVPGVESPGEIIELVDNVWFFVPSEPVEGDANVVPPLPEDIEIIEAYAEAKALTRPASMNPIPAEPSDRLAATFLDGGCDLQENVFAPRQRRASTSPSRATSCFARS